MFGYSYTGYKAGACSHANGLVLALKLLLAPIPIMQLLVALVGFYLYPINERPRKHIQQNHRYSMLDVINEKNVEITLKLTF